MAIMQADPEALELEAAFAAAMDGPAKPREAATPPELDREAPHGRDGDGKPLAPYGWTKPQRKGEEPRPKLAPGRPGKDQAARLTEPGTDVRPPEPGKPDPEPVDYSDALSEFHDAVWIGLTGLGKVGSKIPVVGKFLPEDKLTAEAYVFHASKDRLCGAVALAAEHNASAARFCQKLASGGPTWVLAAGAMIMPVFVQTAAVLAGDRKLKELELPTLAELGAQNDVAMAQAMSEIFGPSEVPAAA